MIALAVVQVFAALWALRSFWGLSMQLARSPLSATRSGLVFQLPGIVMALFGLVFIWLGFYLLATPAMVGTTMFSFVLGGGFLALGAMTWWARAVKVRARRTGHLYDIPEMV